VITYHSGEDRIVARRFRDAAADNCVCPPGAGACRCGGSPSVKLVPRKAITATEDEVDANPRARSARLRVAEKLGAAS
jgi:16S rRNA (cytosine1402-N4)-methyltransferase